MTLRRPEVADVLREFAEAYLRSHPTGALERRVLSSLVACRTAELGGHKRELYDLLFRAASSTLQTIAADERHLGARIGFIAVLHTWGQTLRHHPHVHCLVPGGGLAVDGSGWRACRAGFLLPVRVLSRLFRRRFIGGLLALHANDELSLFGTLEQLREAADWQRYLSALRRREWVVYSKPPFSAPEQVLKYLARYTHRVAISNDRLISCAEGQVAFRWRDYASGHAQRTMTLPVTEFIRRFLLHVLPKGFVRIRHLGFLSNRVRARELERIRSLLGATTPGSIPEPVPSGEPGLPTPIETVRSAAWGRCSSLAIFRGGASFAVSAPRGPLLELPLELPDRPMQTGRAMGRSRWTTRGPRRHRRTSRPATTRATPPRLAQPGPPGGRSNPHSSASLTDRLRSTDPIHGVRV